MLQLLLLIHPRAPLFRGDVTFRNQFALLVEGEFLTLGVVAPAFRHIPREIDTNAVWRVSVLLKDSLLIVLEILSVENVADLASGLLTDHAGRVVRGAGADRSRAETQYPCNKDQILPHGLSSLMRLLMVDRPFRVVRNYTILFPMSSTCGEDGAKRLRGGGPGGGPARRSRAEKGAAVVLSQKSWNRGNR